MCQLKIAARVTKREPMNYDNSWGKRPSDTRHELRIVSFAARFKVGRLWVRSVLLPSGSAERNTSTFEGRSEIARADLRSYQNCKI
eukprot:6213947-Pleurochrysis_carterae.AAC.2